MQKLIECVPNFSEGCDEDVIRQITDAIKSTDGVSLLDVGAHREGDALDQEVREDAVLGDADVSAGLLEHVEDAFVEEAVVAAQPGQSPRLAALGRAGVWQSQVCGCRRRTARGGRRDRHDRRPAGRAALRRGGTARAQGDGSEVTAADTEVEELLRSLIAVLAGFPLGYEDIAPIPVMVTEAGGLVSDLDGNDVLSGNGTVLASNGHIHDALLELVRDVPPGRDYRSLMQGRR